MQPQPQVVMQTDASKTGLGATCKVIRTVGAWSQVEQKFHINVLELLAIKLALITFTKNLSLKSIHFQIDNTTALSYLLKMGGTKNHVLIQLSRKIWAILLTKGITISAEYLPSILNVIADQESRIYHSTEWKLLPKVFATICKKWGTPSLDLFASRVCHQIPAYVAWKPDPYSQGTDAFQQDWSNQVLHAFPPFRLLNRVLNKVRQDQVSNMILVSPTWHTQPWYPELLEMSMGNPILLPHTPLLLENSAGETHPLVKNGTLQLAALVISGQGCVTQAYQKQLPNLFQNVADPHLHKITNRPGRNGLAGVLGKKLIPFDVI